MADCFLSQYIMVEVCTNLPFFFAISLLNKDHGFPRNNSFGRIFKAGENITINLPNSEEAIRRGEYAVVRSLIRVLEVFGPFLFVVI